MQSTPLELIFKDVMFDELFARKLKEVLQNDTHIETKTDIRKRETCLVGLDWKAKTGISQR